MNGGCVIVVGVLFVAGLSESLECFNCQNLVDPHACTNTSQCSTGQSCFLQTVHSGNDIRYNMGCQSNQLCSSSGLDTNEIIGRSIQTRQHYSCHQCCSTSNCNDQLCAHRTPSACIDDPQLDCARLNSIFNVCADVHHAKETCPRFCGLCLLVDGHWADWSSWSNCSGTCENGIQTRTRMCTNPTPSNGGLNCSGPNVESKICANQVHGDWTLWSTWSGCSVTCDVGLRKRTRTCTNPKPNRCGDYCAGDPSEYAVCATNPCSQRSNPVGFSVHGVNILANHVNAFPIIILNTDSVYNSTTGHFTAPVDGMYAFAAQVCVAGDTTAYFFIEKGNDSMTKTSRLTASIVQPKYGTCFSVSTYAQLTRNEHVWLLLDSSSSSSNIIDSSDSFYWTAFSGTLIQRQ